MRIQHYRLQRMNSAKQVRLGRNLRRVIVAWGSILRHCERMKQPTLFQMALYRRMHYARGLKVRGSHVS